ncbi:MULTISPECIES: cytochrome P450 [Amycolatopsis methanolica group]|uniref:cytochrome P450 n=1 Tax=Amycolatopsis methanolica group TaxID=2893674 RepID=UPI0004029278|nr:cytochrome P450 [Amycolatopsis thermoflava]
MTATEACPFLGAAGESLMATADHYNTPLGPDGSPFAYYEALRDEAERTPVAWSQAYGGHWVVGGYQQTVEIMQNTTAFSNKGVTFPRYETGEFELMLAAQDDPVHKNYRKLVAAPFSPAKTAEFGPQLRATANDLIDTRIGLGEGDAASWFANEIPGRLTAIILGLPPEDGELYRKWMWAITHYFVSEPEKAAATFGEMVEHARQLIDERRRNPGDDIMSLVVHAEVDGDRLSDDDLVGFFTVLLIGGIDNTARFLSTALWRLAWDVELRRRLIANPDLLPTAVDEFLRYYSPALLGRLVTEKVTVGGVTMEPGQTAMLWLPVANRDRSAFPYADAFLPDRTPNRHLGLGNGIHRCLGAHLLRVEGQIALGEFLKRIPEFELDRTKKPEWTPGQVSGFSSVPIVFPTKE